jgi:hypothetical protein
MDFVRLTLERLIENRIIDRIHEEHDRLLPLYNNLIIARKNRGAGNTSLKQRQAKRVVMLTRAGKLKKGMALAEKVSIMEDDATTMGRAPLQGEAMREYVEQRGLYPDRVEVLQEQILASNVTFTVEEVADSLQHLNRESSPGMSGWTNEWLTTMASPDHNDKSDEFVQAITSVFNLMVRNKYGQSTLWTDSRLVLIDKPGVDDLRPIAIGDALIRAFGKVLTRNQKDWALQCLQGTQFGVLVKGGAEIVAQFSRMAERVIKYSEPSNDELSIISFDIRNAYGTEMRSVMEQGVIRFMPQLHEAFRFLYGSESRVFHDDGTEVATIKTGVRQGDPMGSLFFCLGMKVLLDPIQLDNAGTKLVAFIDDVNAFGRGLELNRVALQMKIQFRLGGMEINGGKSVIMMRAREEDVPELDGKIGEVHIDEELTIPKYNWFKSMGVPIGDSGKVQAAIIKQVNKAASILPWIHQLPPDIAYALLRFCVNTRLMYLIRNITPYFISEELLRFDTEVDATLCRIAKISQMPPLGYRLRGLPVQLNGLAIPRLADVSKVAFYASLLHAIQYFQLEEGNFLQHINDTRGPDHTTWTVQGAERGDIHQLLPGYFRDDGIINEGGEALDGGLNGIVLNPIVIPFREDALTLDRSHKQSTLFKALNTACYERMIQELRTDGNKVLLCYLLALPSFPLLVPLLSGITSNQAHQLAPKHFIELLRRKMATPLYEVIEGPTTLCPCGRQQTVLIHEDEDVAVLARTAQLQHVGMCTQVNGNIRSHRHTQLRVALVDSIKAANPNHQVRVEQHIPQTHTTVDITTTNVGNGTGAFIDVTYVGTMKGKALRTQVVNGDTAIEEAQGRKEKKLVDEGIVLPALIRFIPFVVTDTGRLGKKAMEYIDSITGWDQVPRVYNAKLACIRKNLLRTIGVITERSNARMRIALRESLVWVA